ncbi:transglutaminase-like domain-containing protein [Amycolatopsis regifaucium]|uniref:Transglutaminase n=1 Tax=Amycolatopsis regifaucium TaxID=546365 RepID=A0A154MFX1_9PSEU|nr:transglutaminase family protein [Amycolatopsis regifaucium]KZB83391.1 transglutaminase [Amycolatopsis regifaucium]OKA08857.1 transglutaminase [Amycolatopsis regifaucium]SFI91856.1 Transglutaminase-like superfamily protein [Amycolatopsis regifaucium]
MKITLEIESERLEDYLVADAVVDHEHPLIRETADRLAPTGGTEVDVIRSMFHFVRDDIAHTVDAADSRVTLMASEVLRERVGLCYAKSHLLAALLRSQGIPAGFCYQRIGVLHGLNGVYLAGLDRWIRLDPRGNKNGADAHFRLEDERLAWTLDSARGEIDFPTVHTTPSSAVVETLSSATPGPAWYEGILPYAP